MGTGSKNVIQTQELQISAINTEQRPGTSVINEINRNFVTISTSYLFFCKLHGTSLLTTSSSTCRTKQLPYCTKSSTCLMLHANF